MSFLKNLFGKKETQIIKTREIDFWQILPFDIFEIPDNSYKVINTEDYPKEPEHLIYNSVKKCQSTHPWLFDTISVSHSTKVEFGKKVILSKNLNAVKFDRIVDYINWISSIYGPTNTGEKEMTKDEKYFLKDSINNPEGMWSRSWFNDETKDPTCMIGLGEDCDTFETLLFFSKKAYR